MNKPEYQKMIESYANPYKCWIRDTEIHDSVQEPERLKEAVLEKYSLYSCEDARIDERFWMLAAESDADFVYSDEDIMDSNGRRDPFFKPDMARESLLGMYFPGAVSLVSKELEEKLSDTAGQKGSLEYLMACALKAEKPLHIAEVLVHTSKSHEYTYSGKSELEFSGKALVSAVILSKDNPGLLKTCVDTLQRSAELEKQQLEIIVIDNGSNDENTAKYEQLAESRNFIYEKHPMKFSYSRLCNIGESKAHGEYILLLNDDIEVPENTRFLRKLLFIASREQVGAAGIKLLYPDGLHIQHNGITFLKSGPSHKLCTYPDDRIYGHGINRHVHNCIAATGACLMVAKYKYDAVGGFDEAIDAAYTDVDLCLALYRRGWISAVVSETHLIHHESFTRADDINDSSAYERLQKEKAYYENKYADILEAGDPFYNPNLTKTELDYSVDYELPGAAFGLSERKDPAFRRYKPLKKQVHIEAESCKYHLSDAWGNENYFEITGWAFVEKVPGYTYEAEVILESGEERLVYNTYRMPREDVSTVFACFSGLELSGFAARIPAGDLKKGLEYRISAAMVKPAVLNKKIYKGYKKETALTVKY
ncbi:MAG: glycosyltransferase [Lachnospiraceae bacterium]|nr:glycosyltransferase [Lachnospiraceae bacterium]